MTRRIVKVLCLIYFGSCLFAGRGIAEEALVKDLSVIRSGMLQNRDQQRLAADLEKGIKFYESLTDYKAIFYKAEKKGESLGETEKIYIKFEKPWKIYMGWLNTSKKGLQVVYEKGQHNGKLVIHKPGLLLGLAPVIFLDQNSPWVREGSASYNIEDAGLGTFLYDFTKAVVRAAKERKLKVVTRSVQRPDGSKVEKMEVTFPGSKPDRDYFAYRVLVMFDAASHLPLEMQLYDWENKPIGSYAYRDLKVNAGRDEKDEEFKKQIDRHLLKVYAHEDSAGK